MKKKMFNFFFRYQDTKSTGRFREDILGTDGIDVTMLIFSGIAQVLFYRSIHVLTLMAARRGGGFKTLKNVMQ